MKFLSQRHLLLALLALAVGAVLLLLPWCVDAAIGALGSVERQTERARREFVPKLEAVDASFGGWRENDYFTEDNLWHELERLLNRSRVVLLVFKVNPSGMTSFSDVGTVSVTEASKRSARLALQRGDELDQEIQEFAEELVETGTLDNGAMPYPANNPMYQIVWRKTCRQTRDRTDVAVMGCLVDYSQTGVLAFVFSEFSVVLGVSLFCLLVVSIGVLVYLLRASRREALLKTTFVSNVSHELRTPLTSLLSYAEMLQTGRCRTEEKRQKALGVILDEGRRLNRMILELLEFSRIERGTRRYRMDDFDLAETVRSTAERLQVRFAENGLGLELPETCVVRSDEDTVRQVLENLLTNAAKYAAKGGPVEVSLSVRDGRVRVGVADRGPGMTRWQMRQAFKPFWRADDSVTKETGGYGIGLSVARAHARGLGGDLMVAARPGGGCAFTFEIPVLHKEEEGK